MPKNVCRAREGGRMYRLSWPLEYEGKGKGGEDTREKAYTQSLRTFESPVKEGKIQYCEKVVMFLEI